MTFEKTVLVPLDPDATFAMLTEPDRLRRWQTVSARVDLRAGGSYRWTVVPGHSAAGTFVEVEPGRRLVYTWGWEGSEDLPPGASTVTLELTPADGGTRVQLTHTGLDEAQAASHAEGWNHYLDRLATAAAGDAGADPWGLEPAALDSLTAAEAALATAQRVVATLTLDQRDLGTPCAKYSVHELMEHLLGSLQGLGGLAGATAVAPDDVHPEVKVAVLGQAALEAWRARGVEGTVDLGSGDMPAHMAVDILALELLVHAWDVAAATGSRVEVGDGVAEFVLTAARAIIAPAFRDGDRFAAEVVVPDTAAAVDRLAAFTGREAFGGRAA